MMSEAKARFFDAWSPWYDLLFPSVVYQALHLRLLEFLTLPVAAQVLDLGCGTGKLLQRLAAHDPTLQGLGVDLSPDMVAQAQAQNPDPTRLSFVPGTADLLPVADQSMDAVFSTISMAHYPDPGAALREIQRVLRPGGQFYWVDGTTCPGFKGQVILPITPGGFRLYSLDERERLGAIAGFPQAQHHYLLGRIVLTILS